MTERNSRVTSRTTRSSGFFMAEMVGYQAKNAYFVYSFALPNRLMERTIITQRNLPKPDGMGRTTTASAGPTSMRSPAKADSYQAQFLKLIPVEVISAYITIEGLLTGSILPKAEPALYQGLLWIVFAALSVLNPLYLRHVSKVNDQRQIWLSAGAFLIYVVSLGGPFLYVGLNGGIIRLLGSILIPIYALIALIILNK